ncbi:MAG TPA: hypothetical protein VNG29_01115, partial [Candidatus Paceibacterota bacterium]|nr:hypothetical protein [Candidatus Paceibacterota bacterium]
MTICNRANIGTCLPAITCSLSSSTITAGGSTSIAANGGTGYYNWSVNGGSPSFGSVTSSSAPASVSFANAGTYAISVSDAYGTGNPATCSVTVNPGSAPVGTIQVKSVDSTNNAPVSASWYFPAGPQDPCNGSLSACSGTGATYNNMATGPYTIQAPFSGQQKPAGYTFGGVR